jgi:hypothetical protein
MILPRGEMILPRGEMILPVREIVCRAGETNSTVGEPCSRAFERHSRPFERGLRTIEYYSSVVEVVLANAGRALCDPTAENAPCYYGIRSALDLYRTVTLNPKVPRQGSAFRHSVTVIL